MLIVSSYAKLGNLETVWEDHLKVLPLNFVVVAMPSELVCTIYSFVNLYSIEVSIKSVGTRHHYWSLNW